MTAEALCAQLVNTLGEIERMLLVPASLHPAPDIAETALHSERDRFESHFLATLLDGAAATEH